MADSRKTPELVYDSFEFKDKILGALGRSIGMAFQGVSTNAPIRAVWRNEVGTAQPPVERTSS